MIEVGKCDVFLDVCTQRDYLAAGGARPSVNAPQLLPRLRHLMAYARWAGVPTLSCIDARRLDEVRGRPNPNCVVGTLGQEKIGFTLLPHHIVVESDNCLSVPLDILARCQQAIFTKRHRDPFTNPKLDRLLTEMPTRRFVVFGVSLESSIRLLVLGLLLRRRRVILVADACGFWNGNEADMTVRQVVAKGCALVTAEALVQGALAKHNVTIRSRAARSRSVA